MHKRKGDTLIEVALAIGIFSMVSIAVVAVVSSSTSSAQSALEATVTREAIDAQAEALRFVQSSYIAGGNANTAGIDKYAKIWQAITAQALDYNTSDFQAYNAALDFSPARCDVLYDRNNGGNLSSLFNQKAFIINLRNLGLSYEDVGATDADVLTRQIVVPATTSGVFYEALTYPRMLYTGENGEKLSDTGIYNSIIANQKVYNLERVEGLYVVAVKDPESTNVVDGTGASARPTTKAAYYDFYIRSCWYNPGAERASSISTVIRLYDPAVIQY